MAMTETRPETDATATGPAPVSPTLDAILATGDHKLIGRMWIASGSLFLLAAVVVSLIGAIETIDLASFSIVRNADGFAQLWSVGREGLMFAAVVPILVGLATYVVPLQVGSGSIAFPRGAAAAFWTWLVSAILFVVAYIDNGGPGGGRLDAVVIWSLALGGMIGAILWAMVCVATTVLGARAPGMTLERVPVSAWGFGVFSIVGLFGLPVLMAQLLLAFIDAKYGYLPTAADRVDLVGIGNSFSLAPSLYWVAIPALGIAVDAIAVQCARPVRFHRSVMAALGLLGIVSFGADVVGFGGRGRTIAFDNGVLVVALLVSVVPVLAILGLVGDALKSGSPKLRAPLVGGLLTGILALLGVVVGVLGTIDPIIGFIENLSGNNINASSALILNGTTFHDGVRALVMGAAIVGGITGLLHWGHKIWGRNLSEGLGLLSLVAVAAGSVLWAIGAVVNGFLEAPLLMVTTGANNSSVEALNLVSTIGLGLLAVGAALVVLNVAGAFAKRGSSTESWRGFTLEWATDSPPPVGNFAGMPTVESAYPLADGVSNVEDQA
jgi:heme/copper-type cytochrome/quinol oxidase subunit 1